MKKFGVRASKLTMSQSEINAMKLNENNDEVWPRFVDSFFSKFQEEMSSKCFQLLSPKEVEKNRTDKSRRITPQVVDNTCVNILHIINEGEKNGE